MRSLESLVAGLSSAAVKAQVWIDGSFLTKKIDPDDVDLLVVIQEQDFSMGMTIPVKRDALMHIVKQEFTIPAKCDSYLSIEYPPGHIRHALGQKQRVYWLKQFGESRSGEKKGIAFLDVPLT